MSNFGRRQLIVILSAVAMVLMSGGLVGGLVSATQSEGGRVWIHAQLERAVNRGLHGRIHLGRLSGNFLTDLTIDSLELRDLEDSVFIASGPLTLRYDPRDLFDGRLIFRAVNAVRPLMIVRRELDDTWNFREIFPVGDTPGPARPRRRGAFGALIVLNDLRITGGEVRLTKPWQPHDSLAGARRDSAIAFGLSDTTRDIRRATHRGTRGYDRTWRWANIDALISRFRLRHPDSAGRLFEITRLAVDETDPPFRISDMQGIALWRGDTVWIDAPYFRLPGSVGSAKGKVEWPTGDTFWDLRFASDSVALNDIAWIYPTLPRTGGGSMRLHVKSRADPDLTDYVITGMDVRSKGSRLRGAMTYGVGGPVLEVRNVNLALAPVDFRFLETLNGGPFPYPWDGTLEGTVRASGGPLTQFQVEHSDLSFTDHNVPGATAKWSGRGELDINYPAFTKFHGFQVALDHFDLRTAQYLNANFPRLNGSMSGTATLDSMWMDVRLRDADLIHRDGDDVASTRLVGTARITMADDFTGVDATAALLPLSADALAKSYPTFPLRGAYSGILRTTGTVANLTLSTDLMGDAGRVQLDARMDAYAPGFSAVAQGTLANFDFRRALPAGMAPTTVFDGRFAVDVAGDSLGNLTGVAELDADRSMVDSVRLFGARVALRFGDGLVHVDSGIVESAAGLLVARGALGLVPRATDALRFQITADSLGGLRRYLTRLGVDSLTAGDSLAGSAQASGVFTGQVRRFALDAAVEGSGLLVRSISARRLRSTFAISHLPDSATGAVTLRLDALRAGTVTYDDVDLRADIRGGRQARTSAMLAAPSGTRIGALADIRRSGDTMVVRFDSLGATTNGNQWSLAHRATITGAGGGFWLDTLALSGTRGGRMNVAGRTKSLDTIAVTLRVDSLPLADLGELLQTRDSMSGRGWLSVDVRGTRARPDLFFTGSLSSAMLARFRVDRMEANGRYADRRLTTSLVLARGKANALHADASLPVDLAFEPQGSRFPDDPLTAHIRTDSAGLDLLEAIIPSMREARGALRIDVDVGGTWRRPRATGSVSVVGGSFTLQQMGLARVEGFGADIGFLGDSIAIRRLTAHSAANRSSSATIDGGIGIGNATDANFRIRLDLQRFNVFNDPRVADLDLTGNLVLSGRRRSAILDGELTVDRGEIRLPELYQKRVISLDDPSQYRVADTTALVDRGIVAAGDTVFMNNLSFQNVNIRMGPDVWLRSAEANIGLGGFVSVARNRVQRGVNAGRSQVVLEGPLQTTRGTFRLNLLPVQRSFTVQSGEVRFYGDPDFNATLDIDALHVVRQVSQQAARPDVRVQVHIGGTRLSPTAELSTPDSLRVSKSDLISYLTTGGPSAEISRGNDYTSTLARALLPSLGSIIGTRVSGGLCDDVQLSTVGLDAYTGIRAAGGQVLQGTRFNCAKQIRDWLFVRLDAGLCQVGRLVDPGSVGASPTNFADSFGAKFDVRVAPEYTLSLGIEPPTSAIYCREDAGARGFAPTPKQFALDLFRLWRF